MQIILLNYETRNVFLPAEKNTGYSSLFLRGIMKTSRYACMHVCHKQCFPLYNFINAQVLYQKGCFIVCGFGFFFPLFNISSYNKNYSAVISGHDLYTK